VYPAYGMALASNHRGLGAADWQSRG